MNPRFDFILFDLIGTTVSDSANQDSLILTHFQDAFRGHGIDVTREEINKHRGKTKTSAITTILGPGATDLATLVYQSFIDKLMQTVDLLRPIEGTNTLFELLRTNGVKIGLGSGLPPNVIQYIIAQVGWSSLSFDYVGSSEQLGRSRPDPVMITDAMNRLNIPPSRVLKVGDTLVDIEEGKRAWVATALVLTGTQEKDLLKKANADFVLGSVANLPEVCFT